MSSSGVYMYIYIYAGFHEDPLLHSPSSTSKVKDFEDLES